MKYVNILQVTVLPPGEWDPSIRIEPPASVPSQENRRVQQYMCDGDRNGKENGVGNCGHGGGADEGDGSGSSELVRTGRWVIRIGYRYVKERSNIYIYGSMEGQLQLKM